MIKNFSNFKKELMKTNLFSSNASVVEKLHLQGEDHQGLLQKTAERTILHRDVERVKNIDEKVIELMLKSEIAQVVPTAGFLIEVFASGTDGRLLRMYREDIVDLQGKVVEEGFERYLRMDIDVK